ncbi:hypothetical protein S40285_10539, partial [Stachybotrys chlorohalonatus IBT 40285]
MYKKQCFMEEEENGRPGNEAATVYIRSTTTARPSPAPSSASFSCSHSPSPLRLCTTASADSIFLLPRLPRKGGGEGTARAAPWRREIDWL